MSKKFWGLFILFGAIIVMVLVSNGLMVFSPPSPPLTQPPTKTELPQVIFSLSPPLLVVSKGQAITEEIVIQSEEPALAVDLDINYNPQVLELTKIEPGNFFTAPMEFSKSIDQANGKIFYATGSLSPSSEMGRKGTVAILTFLAKTDSGETKIFLREKTLVSVRSGKPVNIILPN